MNIIFKRSLAFILSFMIVFSSTSVLAASPAGWATSPADVVINGAQATITAIKGSGSNALKSVITHAPSPATVGKTLLKGATGAALLFAVTQQLGDGIDYVLDPTNNRIKYKNPAYSVPQGDYLYAPYHVQNDRYVSASDACSVGYSKFYISLGRTGVSASLLSNGVCNITTTEGDATQQIVRSDNSQAGTPNNQPEYKYLPISDLSSAVISNAATGHVPSQGAIKAAAIDLVNTGALDDELQASAVPNTVTNPDGTVTNPDGTVTNPDGTVTNPNGTVTNPDGTVTNPDGTVTNPDGTVTNPDGTVTNPDGTITNPSSPSGILKAIKSLATLLGITNTKLDNIADADADYRDWAKAEPTPLDPNTALDIDVPNILPVDTDINFGGSCPANFEVNSSIFGNPINIVLLDTSKFCGFLSTFVKFPVYAVSSLFALYILGGRKDV